MKSWQEINAYSLMFIMSNKNLDKFNIILPTLFYIRFNYYNRNKKLYIFKKQLIFSEGKKTFN